MLFVAIYSEILERKLLLCTRGGSRWSGKSKRELELVLCVTKFIIFILVQIKSSSQDQKQKIILLHYKWVFFKRLIGFKRHDQFLRIFFSNIHRILFGIFSTQQVAEPLRTYAIITLLRYIYPIILFYNLTYL